MSILLNIIGWLIVGGVAGWLAGSVMKMKGGLVTNVIVGIVGAAIGGFLLNNVLNIGVTADGLNVISILVAFFGAVVLLGIMRLIGR